MLKRNIVYQKTLKFSRETRKSMQPFVLKVIDSFLIIKLDSGSCLCELLTIYDVARTLIRVFYSHACVCITWSCACSVHHFETVFRPFADRNFMEFRFAKNDYKIV